MVRATRRTLPYARSREPEPIDRAREHRRMLVLQSAATRSRSAGASAAFVVALTSLRGRNFGSRWMLRASSTRASHRGARLGTRGAPGGPRLRPAARRRARRSGRPEVRSPGRGTPAIPFWRAPAAAARVAQPAAHARVHRAGEQGPRRGQRRLRASPRDGDQRHPRGGWRRASSAPLRNSGQSSSRKRTPWWASVTSPGRGPSPPPTRPTSDTVWCGARNGRARERLRDAESSPATLWMAVTSSASSFDSGGSRPGSRRASIVSAGAGRAGS